MSDRDRIRRPLRDDEVTATAAPTTGVSIDSDEIDDLLDEIDEVLEENAEEFVRNYVQKGGE